MTTKHGIVLKLPQSTEFENNKWLSNEIDYGHLQRPKRLQVISVNITLKSTFSRPYLYMTHFSILGKVWAKMEIEIGLLCHPPKWNIFLRLEILINGKDY